MTAGISGASLRLSGWGTKSSIWKRTAMPIMPTSLRDWATTPEFALLGFVIGIISLLAAVIFYFKTKRERRPRYQSLTIVLVEGGPAHPDGLTFAYKGNPQPRIAVTKVAFWNAGHETIRHSDLVVADPLRIEIHDALILDAMLLKTSAESCKFAVSIVEPAQCNVSFDYIDFRDYVLIQIVHTGTAEAKVRLKGKILGSKKMRRVQDVAQEVERTVTWKVFTSPLVAQYSMVAAGALFLLVSIFLLYGRNFAWYVWVLIGLGILYLIASALEYGTKSPVRLR